MKQTPAVAVRRSRADMTLQLTFSDAQQLKRDSSLALADISFTDGVMRFVGVKVEQGGVTVSTLNFERLE
jgi:hypothetical protein